MQQKLRHTYPASDCHACRLVTAAIAEGTFYCYDYTVGGSRKFAVYVRRAALARGLSKREAIRAWEAACASRDLPDGAAQAGAGNCGHVLARGPLREGDAPKLAARSVGSSL